LRSGHRSGREPHARQSRHAIAGFKVVVEQARADIPKLKADLKALLRHCAIFGSNPECAA
jgi:hypothetical protein